MSLTVPPTPAPATDEPPAEGASAASPAGTAAASDLPGADALLAAVVALMSAHANPSPDLQQDLAAHRRLLARKVLCNLGFLRRHPDVPAPLRQVMAHAASHWTVLAEGPVGAPPPATDRGPGAGWLH